MLKLARYCPAIGLVILALGCATPDSDTLKSVDKPKLAFDGKPDSRFVGSWKSSSGSIYKFEKDGSYVLDGQVKTPGGIMKNHVAGAWGYKDPTMLFKDAQGNVVPYKCSLAGNTLKLTTVGTLAKETVLQRS